MAELSAIVVGLKFNMRIIKSKSGRIDLTGQKFNKLLVQRYAYTKGKEAFWECVCECGNVALVRAHSLIGSNTKSCGCLKKESKNKGSKNGMWVGDKIKPHPLHGWIKRHKPKPTYCENCGKNPPYDLANISQEYKRDINDFEWLCRSCHMTKDGRMSLLRTYKRKVCNHKWEKHSKQWNHQFMICKNCEEIETAEEIFLKQWGSGLEV